MYERWDTHKSCGTMFRTICKQHRREAENHPIHMQTRNTDWYDDSIIHGSIYLNKQLWLKKSLGMIFLNKIMIYNNWF